MARLCSVGLALWPDSPAKIEVTAAVLSRECYVLATGTSEGTIWLWRMPVEWRELGGAVRLPKRHSSADEGHEDDGSRSAGGEVHPLALLCGEHKDAISALVVCNCPTDGSRGALPWAPTTVVEVSCKSRYLVACAGASPDVEVFDVTTMRRLVRLFGHGDWCVDIRTRHMDNVPGVETLRDTEPTIYSIDRAGTLCCWLPDRNCGRGVVGWVPSLQVHCVPVAFPTCLALDAHSRCLMVFGIGECVGYALGKDHKIADKQASPKLVRFGAHAARGLPREVHAGDAAIEAPEKTRRRRHASVAASRPPLRRWNSAPPDADEGQGMASPKAKEAHGVVLDAKGEMDLVKGMEMEGRGLSDLQRWTKVRAVMMPAEARALVWEQGAGLYMVDLDKGYARQLHAGHVSSLASDSEGWFVMTSPGDHVHVWGPHAISAGYSEAVRDMNAHAALRQRYRQEARERDVHDDASVSEAGVHEVHVRHTREVAPQDAHASRASKHQESTSRGEQVEGSKALNASSSSPSSSSPPPSSSSSSSSSDATSRLRARGLADFTAIAQEWTFAGAGRLMNGWEGAAARASQAAGAEDDLEPTCTLLHVQGARPLRDPVSGEDASGSNKVDEVRIWWVVAMRNGLVQGYELPEGKVDMRLQGHGCTVHTLLWPHRSSVIISGAADGTVRLWRARDSQLMHTYHEHSAAVTSLFALDHHASSFLRASNVVCSCSADCSVMLAVFDAPDASAHRVLSTLRGHSSVVTSVQWAPRHGHLYTCCSDGSVHVWQLQQHQPSQLIRVVPASLANIVLQAIDRHNPHLGTHASADASSARGVAEDGDSEGREAACHHVLHDEDEHEPLEFLPPVEAAQACGTCPAMLVMRADVVALLASKGKDSSAAHVRPMRPSSPEGNDSPMMPPTAVSSPSRTSVSASPQRILHHQVTPHHQGAAQQQLTPTRKLQQLQVQQASLDDNDAGSSSGRCGSSGALMMALAGLMSQLTCPAGSPESSRSAIASALADVAVPSFLAPEYTGTFDCNGAFRPPPLQASIALVGAGKAVTCLVPMQSTQARSLGVSQGFTSAVTLSAAVLLEAYRALCPSASRPSEAAGELVHYVVKGLAGRVTHYRDSNVISLAKYWLLAPDAARQAAHVLLTASLGRTDAAKRKDIVAEWTPRLDAGVAAGVRGGGEQQRGGQYEGGAQGAVGAGADGFTGKEGPALVVLAVIGSHFKEALDRKTCARVAEALVRAVSSSNALHAKVASHLLSRGAHVWGPHIKDGEGLLRTLYARYWRYNDFSTTMADSEWALRCIAPVLPSQFVEVVGEEASRHSQLVCHVRSERSVTAIKVLVALFKKNPVEMLPALPRAVEVVLRTLDPGHPLVRQALMQHSTAALKEIVRKFPMSAFHQDTQRFAVGTVDALVVIYDLRTATKWRVLEGHESAISAVTFDASGQRLATFSADEGRIRYWEAGTSGPFGLFGSKVGRCVQQFTVPQSYIPKYRKGTLDCISFRVLFTPTAIVLTRDSVPLCEFALG